MHESIALANSYGCQLTVETGYKFPCSYANWFFKVYKFHKFCESDWFVKFKVIN